MIFSLLKFIVWLAGIGVIAYYGLPYVGYQVNLHYFEERKSQCQEQLDACRQELFRGGVEGAKENCDLGCVDPKVLIRKQQEEASN